MKSVFLSMLAIAALASSCSKQEFVDPPGPQEGTKKLVDIILSSGKQTKAAGAATVAEDKTINDVTVFFLNPTDQIVSKQWVSATGLTDNEDGTAKTATVETRSTASQMMVIANLGNDRTTGTLNVSTKAQLEAVVQSLINTDTPPLPVQVKGDVLMSGIGAVEDMTADADGGNSTATSAVTLNFVAAKINLSKIELGADVKGIYGTDYKFTRAFLLNVQTNSWYFPTANSYIPTPKAYANGVAWEGNWGTDPGYTVAADFNQSLNYPDMNAAKTDIAHWYVFENNPASVASSENPTILVVEVEWTKTKADPTEGVEEVKVMKMFNVIFAPGDKGVIKAGQAYNVALTFNGDFRPEDEGGNGGGGDDNPDQPNVNANVAITVTPADWTDQSTEKPFE